MIDRTTAEHYSWGAGCDGWILSADQSLSVIEERMPGGAAELRHYHELARQFFFVLSGELTMILDSGTERLRAGQGIEIAPRSLHQAVNDGAEDVRFLVISSPTTRGDRINS